MCFLDSARIAGTQGYHRDNITVIFRFQVLCPHWQGQIIFFNNNNILIIVIISVATGMQRFFACVSTCQALY